jgi:hypothetical protein
MVMSFADIFNPAAPAAPQTPTPTPTPAAAPTQNPAIPPAAGVIVPNQDPFSKSTVANPAPPTTAPLDIYNDLYKIDPNRKEEDPNAPYITYDEKALNEKIGAMEFLGGEQLAELATKAAGGDAAALITLLNETARASYSQGAKLSANISNRAALASAQQVRGQLPTEMRSQLASSELNQLNPALSHPAMEKHAQSTLAAFEQKYPTATPAELAKMTNDFFSTAFKAINPPAPEIRSSGPQPIAGSQNFEGFFGQGRR